MVNLVKSTKMIIEINQWRHADNLHQVVRVRLLVKDGIRLVSQ